MILNLGIGLNTPPVGAVQFVACAVGKITRLGGDALDLAVLRRRHRRAGARHLHPGAVALAAVGVQVGGRHGKLAQPDADGPSSPTGSSTRSAPRSAAATLQPGARLPTETQLTEKFGVSRTVVREAMRRLAADGLVSARQGAGVFVQRADAGRCGDAACRTWPARSRWCSTCSRSAWRSRSRPPRSPRSAGPPRRRPTSRRPSSSSTTARPRRADRRDRFRLPPGHRRGHQQSVLRRDARRARPPHHPLRPASPRSRPSLRATSEYQRGCSASTATS